MSIQLAQKARSEKALQGLVRTEYGVTTKAEFMRLSKKAGAIAIASEKPKSAYNRRKFNSMDKWQQDEYEKRMNEMVPCYKLYDKPKEGEEPSIYTEISKSEFDYFNSL